MFSTTRTERTEGIDAFGTAAVCTSWLFENPVYTGSKHQPSQLGSRKLAEQQR